MGVKQLCKVSLYAALFFPFNHTTKALQSVDKILEISSIAEIKGFDPAQVIDVYSTECFTRVYEGLLEYHYLKRPIELVPNLAAEMPTISSNGLIYTFKIKQGVRFHDNLCFPNGKGREVVAADFVYSIKRLADPKICSPCWNFFKGKIKGLDDWRKKEQNKKEVNYKTNIAGLQAVDKYTFQIILSHPDPLFLYLLALGCCSVVPHEAVACYGLSFLNHPVGTGPFVVQEFKPHLKKIIFTKNPSFREKYFPSEAAPQYRYMLAYAGKKLPFVDKIVNNIITEDQPQWLKFKKNELDIFNVRASIIKMVIQNKQLIPDLQKKGIQLFIEPDVAQHAVIFNSESPPFKGNKKLRQAISFACDRVLYNSLFYDGLGESLESIIPVSLVGHKPGYKNPYGIYDLEKAKQCLIDAGYPNGVGLPPITLDITCGTTNKQTAEFFAKCMKKIGIQIIIIENTFQSLSEKISKKATMMHSMGWIADYPDADSFLNLLCSCNLNFAIFSDPAYDLLYTKLSNTQNSLERKAIYEQLNEMAAELTPAVYLINNPMLVLYHKWVKNYIKSPFHYGIEQYIDIDRTLKD